ncbi:MAG: VWA domain-containing protein [Sandaracinaceae bacterium]|nr:VWA domain-containing protein [Sandaracinaceae bacterium]
MSTLRFALVFVSLATALGGCAATGGDQRYEGPYDPEPEDGGDPTPREPGDECGNGFDDDADGRVDEDCVCVAGEQQRCFLGERAHAGVGQCTWGSQDCVVAMEFGTWDDCVGYGVPSDEVCDGVDNDCDGIVDEGCECLLDEERSCYTGAPGTEGVGLCRAGRQYCVPTETGSVWSECVGETLPGAVELCDGAGDEDCDGLIDEGCECVLGTERACYGGPADTLGVGECRAGVQLCEGVDDASSWGACAGAVLPRAEACTGGRDEDCDGLVDCADPDCATDRACCTPFLEDLPIVPPDGEVLFVVDRSGSMQWPASGTTRTRWQELERAMTTILPLTGDLHTGLLTFPQVTGGDERLYCGVATTPDVGLGLANGGAISARLAFAQPRAGDTPTPDALATVRRYLETRAVSRPRFVVLLTDGLPEPNCGATVPATVSAIAALRRDLGVDTFVVGIVGPDRYGSTAGIPALRAGLNEMADAGGRARAGDRRYYEAVDGPAIDRALRAILSAATDCHFELSAPPARPAAVEVRRDGLLVPASEWTLTGRRLELSGAACAAIRAGTVGRVEIADRCGG